MNITQLLDQFRAKFTNTRDLGTQFERLIKSYLKLDPIYVAQFKNVWLWNEWPHKWGPDCGIDLIAEDHAGNYAAIQCKFYAADYQIKKEDIDSFFTESGKTFKLEGKKISFHQRIIVSTSDVWSDNAERSLDGQTIPVTRIHVRELEQSPIDWSQFSLEKPEKLKLREKKKLRPHQREAIDDILKGFKSNDRGKLIMACGTGKTFTALRLAEEVTPKNGVVLFLVPSISLLSQTLREWTAESENPFHAFAVCSDRKVGKDNEDISRHDLAIPATTDTASLLDGLESVKRDGRMTVVFSTYQSIDVISKAQSKGFPLFDLVICDEAHRTTGVILADKEESHFVKVHDQKFIKGKKRLYMTATPRLFSDSAKTKAEEAGAELCSMDDESKYGPEFHRLGFGKAVNGNLLTDYKVLVLAVDESIIDPKFQRRFANEDKEIPLEDIAKIIGCWNGLSKKFVGEEAEVEDSIPMKRAVAFARAIKDSKQIASVFQAVVSEYIKKNPALTGILNCELEHVDGTFNVLDRNTKLDWLKSDAPENTCRILTNARCLSEGVDVPALDAVLFLNPRDSMVDVVQSVGRIMRKAEGKKYGYVILPIGIPAGVPPEEALKDNKKYKVVWQVLQALRAHDDRFNATINQIDLNKKRPSNIQVIGVGGPGASGERGEGSKGGQQMPFNFPEIEEWKDAIYAKIVLKCGSRPYWENWAKDVAKIAESHSEHIRALLSGNNSIAREAFNDFQLGLRKNINPTISESDAIEMLSQHLITKPIFDALFEHYPFTEKNPVSKSMQSVLRALESDSFKRDAAKLNAFYESVRLRVKGIDNAEGRQKVILELYDRFFKEAFPKMAERLGIVYTPVEIVDFIINSLEFAFGSEFGKSLSDVGVHILDPFTGTGTFIVRLLQSGIIRPSDLKRKLTSEIHTNEIVLLAYYIAAINIEETFHSLSGNNYSTFEGATLTDTFQMSETENQASINWALPENSTRAERQKTLPIQVILGNPPYSAGQTSDDDNNANLEYPKLDRRIAETYVANSKNSGGKKSLYDSYIRAIRWASDRLKGDSIMGVVTGNGFIEKPAMDGVRRSLQSEFSKIYIINLRGDIRKNILSKGRAKEGENVFGSGSMTGISITILIKRKERLGDCVIKYCDIGDELSRGEKLTWLKSMGSIQEIELANRFSTVALNEHCDWTSIRTGEFSSFLPLIPGQNTTPGKTVFADYSSGVVSSRDAWVYNWSKENLIDNVSRFLDFYNSEVNRYSKAVLEGGAIEDIDDFVVKDPSKIKWGENLKRRLKSGTKLAVSRTSVVTSLRRPFLKTWHYYDKNLNHSLYSMPMIFPLTNPIENKVICVSGIGARSGFGVIVSNCVVDFQTMDNGLMLPYKIAISNKVGALEVSDGISDWALELFRRTHSEDSIKKEDIFYYVYGIFHSPSFRKKYENDLAKEAPRIPICKNFWIYSRAGKALCDLHLNYESVEPYPLSEEVKVGAPENPSLRYKVNERGMHWVKEGKTTDISKIVYNEFISLTKIPKDAYEYVIGSKSAIEWVMERYCISRDINSKGIGSGIVDDPNEWSDNPRYIIDLLKRVVRVSLETNKIVKNLPELTIIDEKI